MSCCGGHKSASGRPHTSIVKSVRPEAVEATRQPEGWPLILHFRIAFHVRIQQNMSRRRNGEYRHVAWRDFVPHPYAQIVGRGLAQVLPAPNLSSEVIVSERFSTRHSVGGQWPSFVRA